MCYRQYVMSVFINMRLSYSYYRLYLYIQKSLYMWCIARFDSICTIEKT